MRARKLPWLISNHQELSGQDLSFSGWNLHLRWRRLTATAAEVEPAAGTQCLHGGNQFMLGFFQTLASDPLTGRSVPIALLSIFSRVP